MGVCGGAGGNGAVIYLETPLMRIYGTLKKAGLYGFLSVA